MVRWLGGIGASASRCILGPLCLQSSRASAVVSTLCNSSGVAVCVCVDWVSYPGILLYGTYISCVRIQLHKLNFFERLMQLDIKQK